MGSVGIRPCKKVAEFGAGIAGLTAAHELARRGWLVSVYESNAEAGGFFRSARRVVSDYTPSEYSWHGMGPWYFNVFDLIEGDSLRRVTPCTRRPYLVRLILD